MESSYTYLHYFPDATSNLAANAVAHQNHLSVGFTAHLTKTVTNLAPHQQVVFNNVISNVGDAYNSSQGHFTSPVLGVYVFFVTATNIPGHSVSLSLMSNSNQIAFTLAHGASAILDNGRRARTWRFWH